MDADQEFIHDEEPIDLTKVRIVPKVDLRGPLVKVTISQEDSCFDTIVISLEMWENDCKDLQRALDFYAETQDLTYKVLKKIMEFGHKYQMFNITRSCCTKFVGNVVLCYDLYDWKV
jgi:hypothetical protein